MRRQLSEERKRLHKNTHNWSRIRYRKMLLAHVNQHYARKGAPYGPTQFPG